MFLADAASVLLSDCHFHANRKCLLAAPGAGRAALWLAGNRFTSGLNESVWVDEAHPARHPSQRARRQPAYVPAAPRAEEAPLPPRASAPSAAVTMTLTASLAAAALAAAPGASSAARVSADNGVIARAREARHKIQYKWVMPPRAAAHCHAMIASRARGTNE